ncbi:MarR family transcriptional regulator [Tenacibaculum sp. Bg11-29]|uniref:MarR family winged helix-turn-helix transcriptional regulator n=1 Tax=Tenacibaculum sp. Bg11-29 TaxID=2058306 RepID=UPI000C34E972|nr:MarR family transcriptional regulator [Tenacibaculum sp. Bg11-29]PKH52846.1 MarR family transcriptional regulator [Tenacibaculum sp. Bg11-29]
MSADLINEMGYIALATRLKRISDKMSHSTRLMYKQIDMDIEPNWYLVLILVKEKPNISVMEIAKSMGFTHQSVNTITSKMMKKGYLKISKDTKDKRKTVFNITSKSIDALPEIEKVWGIGKKVIYELLDEDITILKHLDTLESNLDKTSFGQRIIDKLDSTENEKS